MSGKLNIKRKGISLLTVRILAIMIFPLFVFLAGFLAIDSYRITLIEAELEALERQGLTMARSLALEEARRFPNSPRQLSPETMRQLLPLVGYGSSLRARVFDTNGAMIADTQRLAGGRPQIRVKRHRDHEYHELLFKQFYEQIMGRFEQLTGRPDIQIVNINAVRHARQLPDVAASLSGQLIRNIFFTPRGELVLSVSLPVADLRVIKGALLITKVGRSIEQKIADVNRTFFIVFLSVLFVTIALGIYLSTSIIRPVLFLASAADTLRQTKDVTVGLKGLPFRRDEIGQLSASLVAMTQELQNRIKATASFAADVAHELKNPLTSLRSAVETISRIDDADQQRRLMNVIINDVNRLDRLITDISSASRLDAELTGELPPASDLREIIGNWTAMLSQRHERVAFDISLTDRPVMVQMHISRILQILDNLIDNALSFHPEGEVLTIRFEVIDDMASITVADKGPGIPAGLQERIFERFYTERPQSEAFGNHSGLGLSISRQIAQMHNGNLTAGNNTQAGAYFTLSLPVASR